VTSGRGWGWIPGAVWASVLLTACAATEPAPSPRTEFTRLESDLTRIEQSIQRNQAEIKADLQRLDRQASQSLFDLQKSVAQVGSRLDDLGHDAAQIQGRLDELRRRVDALALQLDVVGVPPPVASPPASRPGPAAPSAPTAQAEPARPAPVAPSATSGPAPAAPGPGAPAGSPPPGGASGRQATDLYQTAYIDYTKGNYNLAIAAFKEFIRLYPNTDLAEKAQYWIGESHFSLARDLQTRGDRTRAAQEFERAAQEFRQVLVNYPRSDRVPTAVYKEALARLELGQSGVAEARLQFLVDQFPYTEEAAKAKEELAKRKK
jgi:TolA-binding protein